MSKLANEQISKWKSVKELFFVFVSAFIFQHVSAQYCGSPGNFTCPASDSIPAPGYYPPQDSFPALINNLQTKTTLAFLNFDSILFGNEVLHVYSLTFDSIDNLPPGLCWQTNQPDGTYNTGQTGCIQLSGTPCGPTGQYKLTTIITLDIGSPVTTNGDGGGFEYFVRLKNYGDADTPVDTTQPDSMPVIYYGDTCHPELPLTINLANDSIFCGGTIINFNPDVTGGLPPYTYTWQSTNAALSCSSCAYPVTTLYQNSSFTLTIADANGETVTQTVNYMATGTSGNFQIIALGPINYCDTGTVTLTSNAGVSATYQWLLNDSIIPGANESSYRVINSPGAYTLQFEEPGVCTATSNVIPISFSQTPVVLISTLGSVNLCLGSMVILQADTLPNLVYQWQLNNINIVDSSAAFYLATNPGNYRLVVTSPQYCSDTSNVITVTINPNPPPSASFAQYFGDTICNNSSPFALTGGNPEGGNYSGRGVSHNNFNPDSANFGINYITYTYTDSDGCSGWAQDSITLVLCTGVETINNNFSIALFPNPAATLLSVQSTLFLTHAYTIDLYDITGKRVSLPKRSITHSQTDKLVLNVAALSPGLYFLNINLGGQKIVKRFVKVD